MKQYQVLVTSTHVIEVEADSAQEAIDSACSMAWEQDATSIDGVILNTTDNSNVPVNSQQK